MIGGSVLGGVSGGLFSLSQRGSGGVTAEATALFAAMTTPPSAARRSAINTCIVSLKAAGVWSKLSVLQVHAAADAQAASLNWINPASGAATLVNSPTFTADKGWTTNGSSQYINTNWTPSSDALFVQDSAMQGCWFNFGATGSGTERGAWGPGPSPRAGVSLGASAANPNVPSFNVNLNSNYATSQWNVPGFTGWLHGCQAMQRDDSTTLRMFSNGAEAGNTTGATSVTRPLRPYWLGALNNDGSPANYGVGCHGAFFAGAALTSAQHLALSTALSDYMTAISNVVPWIVGWGDSLSSGTYYAGLARQSDDTGRAFRRYVSQGVSGETPLQIADRMVADGLYREGYVPVIWAVRNAVNNAAQTVDSASVRSNIARMVDVAYAHSGGKFLVLGGTNGNLNGPSGGAQLTNSEASGTAIHAALVQLNSDLSTDYGSHFLDIRALMVAQGLSGDANDQIDAAADIPPRNLMLDDVHFSPNVVAPYTKAGTDLVGRKIETKLQALGY